MATNPLLNVESWLYHLGSASNAQIAASGADLVVLDYSRDGSAARQYRPADLAAMRRSDPDKLIVSYLSIGEAEDYRYYWNSPEFRAIRSSVVVGENAEWEGNYKVKYWDPRWQKVMFDYADKIVKAGFNGLYLDIIDAFHYWEARAPKSSINFRQEMAEFVRDLRAHVQETLAEIDPGRKFVILGQNGDELLRNSTYRAAIDGVGREDLGFYYEYGDQDNLTVHDRAQVAADLRALEASGKPTFVIEYLDSGQRSDHLLSYSQEMTLLDRAGVPVYVAPSRDLNQVYTQPHRGNDGDNRLIGSRYSESLDGRGGNDVLDGMAGHDRLFGRAGADSLQGGIGNDRLNGGAGRDKLYGGSGQDVFVLETGAGARDLVMDFNAADDRLFLDRSDLGLTSRDRLRVISQTYDGDNGRGAHLIYDSAHRLILDLDPGDGRFVILATVRGPGAGSLTAADLIFG